MTAEGLDPELVAMAKVAEALGPLAADAQKRVVSWAANRYGAVPVSVPPIAPATQARSGVDYEEFVDLFHDVNPRTDAGRALVASYWFQVVQGRGALRAQELNDALKDLGHRLPNVTDALSKLEDRRPALLRQVSKSGRSRQSRKTYRLTQEGVAEVKRLLAQGAEAEGGDTQ
jgi:hypothetical protein